MHIGVVIVFGSVVLDSIGIDVQAAVDTKVSVKSLFGLAIVDYTYALEEFKVGVVE